MLDLRKKQDHTKFKYTSLFRLANVFEKNFFLSLCKILVKIPCFFKLLTGRNVSWISFLYSILNYGFCSLLANVIIMYTLN